MIQDKRNFGFPTGNVEGADWSYNPGFGGSGGLDTPDPSPYRYVYFAIDVDPFSIQNNKLVLHNESFLVYSDSAKATKAGFKVMIAYVAPDGSFDPSKALSTIEVPASTTLPMVFEYDQTTSDKEILPQPDKTQYQKKIFVIVDLLVTGRYINTTDQVIDAFRVASFQYEGTP